MEQCPYCKCLVEDDPDAINGLKPYSQHTSSTGRPVDSNGELVGCSFCRGDMPEDFHNCDDDPPPTTIKLADRHCRHYCGGKHCDRHWLSIGNWYQGSGFSGTEAKEIVHRYNAYNDLVAAAEAALPTMSIGNPREAELLAKAVCRANGWQYGTVKDTVELLYEANRLRAKDTEVQG